MMMFPETQRVIDEALTETESRIEKSSPSGKALLRDLSNAVRRGQKEIVELRRVLRLSKRENDSLMDILTRERVQWQTTVEKLEDVLRDRDNEVRRLQEKYSATKLLAAENVKLKRALILIRFKASTACKQNRDRLILRHGLSKWRSYTLGHVQFDARFRVSVERAFLLLARKRISSAFSIWVHKTIKIPNAVRQIENQCRQSIVSRMFRHWNVVAKRRERVLRSARYLARVAELRLKRIAWHLWWNRTIADREQESTEHVLLACVWNCLHRARVQNLSRAWSRWNAYCLKCVHLKLLKTSQSEHVKSIESMKLEFETKFESLRKDLECQYEARIDEIESSRTQMKGQCETLKKRESELTSRLEQQMENLHDAKRELEKMKIQFSNEIEQHELYVKKHSRAAARSLLQCVLSRQWRSLRDSFDVWRRLPVRKECISVKKMGGECELDSRTQEIHIPHSHEYDRPQGMDISYSDEFLDRPQGMNISYSGKFVDRPQDISHISTASLTMHEKEEEEEEEDWIDISLEDLRKQQLASAEALRRHKDAQKRLVQELSIISERSLLDEKCSESGRRTPEWHSPKRGSHVSPEKSKKNIDGVRSKTSSQRRGSYFGTYTPERRRDYRWSPSVNGSRKVRRRRISGGRKKKTTKKKMLPFR